jgi:ATP-dependent Clp protease ATP-binding subunit ClpA
MPKINVYLPDDLSDAVKDSGVPVSAVCQRALEEAVSRVRVIRGLVLGDLDYDNPTGALARFTARTRTVLRLSVTRAAAAGAAEVRTEDLLGAMLAEGTNLAVRILQSLSIASDTIARALPDAASDAPRSDPQRLDSSAANAFELAITEAMALGHNYVGCEHLLLGLLVEPDGVAGAVLREAGIDAKTVRRTVGAATLGYAHQQATSGSRDIEALEAIMTRLERIERHLDLPSRT